MGFEEFTIQKTQLLNFFMLKYFFLAILISMSFSLSAQVNTSYYSLTNKADSLIFEKKIPEAYLLYLKALRISDIDPYSDIELVKLALKVKDFKRANKYIKIAIKNGAFLGMLEADSNVNKFFKKDIKWKGTYDFLRQKHLAKIPYLEDRTTLLNMLEKDQALRSLLGVIEFKKADSVVFAADTANMTVMKQIIQRIGFPDQQKVGMDGATATFILLLHILNNKNNDEKNLEILTPLMKQAVIELKYPPFYMAIVIDRHRAINKKKQVYGAYWEMGEQNKRIVTPIENIIEVDKRRKEIGLPPLSILKKQLGYELPPDYRSN